MKRLPAELKYHKQYPIFKKDFRNGVTAILNEKEAITIQSNNFGEGDGFRFRHFKSRGKVLDLLKGTTITKEEFINGSSKLIESYIKPLQLLSSGKDQKLLTETATE